MEVGSSLILSSAEITALGSTVDEVLESLTLPNPEYQNKIRFGRNKKFYSSIPRPCVMYHVRVQTMFCPVIISGNLENTVMREGTFPETSNSHYVITSKLFGMKTGVTLMKVQEYFLKVNAVLENVMARVLRY